ncbi:MAG: hypothetical protein KAR42_11155 [candidate division Zixibacteria bacterium]|nr:hypothetical protein [candidate division Zixibacteria bacterium]
MTNSEMFKRAHKVAARTARIVGDYRIAFSLALKVIIKTARLAKQLTDYALHVQWFGGRNAGNNDYTILVKIYNDTVKLNNVKKSKFNWAKFDDTESGCY